MKRFQSRGWHRFELVLRSAVTDRRYNKKIRVHWCELVVKRLPKVRDGEDAIASTRGACAPQI